MAVAESIAPLFSQCDREIRPPPLPLSRIGHLHHNLQTQVMTTMMLAAQASPMIAAQSSMVPRGYCTSMAPNTTLMTTVPLSLRPSRWGDCACRQVSSLSLNPSSSSPMPCATHQDQPHLCGPQLALLAPFPFLDLAARCWLVTVLLPCLFHGVPTPCRAGCALLVVLIHPRTSSNGAQKTKALLKNSTSETILYLLSLTNFTFPLPGNFNTLSPPPVSFFQEVSLNSRTARVNVLQKRLSLSVQTREQPTNRRLDRQRMVLVIVELPIPKS